MAPTSAMTETFDGSVVVRGVIEILSVFHIELCMFGLASLTYALFFWRRNVTPEGKRLEEVEVEAMSDARPPDDRCRRLAGKDADDVRQETRRSATSTRLAASAVLATLLGFAICYSWPLLQGGPEIAAVEEAIDSDPFEGSLESEVCSVEASKKAGDASPTASELHERLRCHRMRIVTMTMRTGEPCDPLELLRLSRRLLHDVEALVMLCGSIAEQMEALQVVRNHEDLQAGNDLEGLKGVDAVGVLAEHATSLIQDLSELELPYRDALAALGQSIEAVESMSSDGPRRAKAAEVLNQLLSTRGAARDCLLKAMREARVLSLVFRYTDPSPQPPLDCVPGSLAGVERLAIREAKLEDDDNGDTYFDLAMYSSIVSVYDGGALCFKDSLSGSTSVRDARGMFVPSDIAEAEHMLLSAEESTFGEWQSQRAASRAIRLHEHASFLASQQLDSAAEWRFRAAASLAATHGDPKQAAVSLSRLGALLMLRSRRREALAAAEEALAHAEDPLAQYLQTSLRLSLGEVRTGAGVRAAAAQLRALADTLPFKSLEAERAALQADLDLWNTVAEGDVRNCLRLYDVAKVLLCFVSKFALAFSDAPATH